MWEGVAVKVRIAREWYERATVADAAGLDAPELRRAIARGVVWAESRRPAPFATPLRAGVDYVVAGGD